MSENVKKDEYGGFVMGMRYYKPLPYICGENANSLEYDILKTLIDLPSTPKQISIVYDQDIYYLVIEKCIPLDMNNSGICNAVMAKTNLIVDIKETLVEMNFRMIEYGQELRLAYDEITKQIIIWDFSKSWIAESCDIQPCNEVYYNNFLAKYSPDKGGVS